MTLAAAASPRSKCRMALGEHPDKDSTDVAVAVIAEEDMDKIEGTAIPIGRLFTEEHAKVTLKRGHDVAMLGLFVRHAGTARAEPVARFGRISLLAKERIPIDLDKRTPTEIQGCLVESLSWSGESGAPVFTADPGGQAGRGLPNRFGLDPGSLGDRWRHRRRQRSHDRADQAELRYRCRRAVQ